jgi:hypothetical protein
MKLHLIEISQDGCAVLWQPHLLTDVMRARATDDLALEPVLLPPGDAATAPFKVANSGSALSWQWGDWKAVELVAVQAGEASRARKVLPPQPPLVEWRDLPSCDAVEMTFYDAGDTRGVVKVEASRVAVFGREVEFTQPRGGIVGVRLLDSVKGDGTQVERLIPSQEEGFRFRRASSFRPGENFLRVPVADLGWGILAVVRRRRGRLLLLAYVHYDGEKNRVSLPDVSSRLGAAELQRLRRWFGEDTRGGRERGPEELTLEDWLDNWPGGARGRFERLVSHARARLGLDAEGAGRLLRACPTGLARYLALTLCGHVARNAEQDIRRLDEGSFQAALGALSPRLAAALAELSVPEEKGWAVAHSHSPCLSDAVAWAGGQGTGALGRALHLFEKRGEAAADWAARARAGGTPTAVAG